MSQSVLCIVLIAHIVLLEVFGETCVEYGAGLSKPHACRCQFECGGPYCNNRGFVENRLGLSGPFPSDSTLCPTANAPVCCCSCPNCQGFINSGSQNQAPTSSPTLAPTLESCNTTDAYNIAFLLDESGSINRQEWRNTIGLVDRLIQSDISALSYVTLYEFSSRIGFDHFLNWTAVEDPVGSGDRSIFTSALYGNRYNLAGMTYTWEAVNRVLDDFWTYRFTCKDDCDRRSDVLIVLTDGRPTDQVCPNLAARLNQTEIDVVAIGVNMTESEIASITCLDVRDNGVDIISVPSYSDFDLRQVELDVRDRVCDGASPLGTSVRPAPDSRWDYGNGTYGLGPVPQGGNNGGTAGVRDT